jgi:hypothetical protein
LNPCISTAFSFMASPPVLSGFSRFGVNCILTHYRVILYSFFALFTRKSFLFALFAV